MSDNSKKQLRVLVRSLYDLQKLRIQSGNRIAINFRSKLGQDPGVELTDAKAKQIIATIKSEYKRLTDGISNLTNKGILQRFAQHGDGVITDATEFRLVQWYINLLGHEESGFRSLGAILESYPIWTAFLKDVKGIGPAMGGVIIGELDPHKARHVSSFWKFCGLDVASDGRGRSRKKEHLVRVSYINRDGEEAERDSMTFSPFIKTKLLGVLASSFLRSGNEQYAGIYYGYKNRLLNHEIHKEKTDGHRHNMSMRYMTKCFLADLWVKWRGLEGLPVSEPYSVDKLGMRKHAA